MKTSLPALAPAEAFLLTITAPELEALSKAASTLDVISEHLSSAIVAKGRYRSLKQAASIAQAAYVNDPSTEKFSAFQKLVRERDQEWLLFSKVVDLRRATAVVIDRFRKARFFPLVTPIVERNLELARQRLAGITQAENARHQEIFGGACITSSRLINAAADPVSKLEKLNACIKTGDPSDAQMRNVLASLLDFR
jgi:hypothetical protein